MGLTGHRFFVEDNDKLYTQLNTFPETERRDGFFTIEIDVQGHNVTFFINTDDKLVEFLDMAYTLVDQLEVATGVKDRVENTKVSPTASERL